MSALVLAVGLQVSEAAPAVAQASPDVGPLKGQPFVRMTGDIRGYELVPSFDGSYKGAPFRTNRWGMRDKEYARKPPARTYRMALLGSSFTMGGGVPAEQTIEWLLEDRLNQEALGPKAQRYEILNFSVGGYGILQNVAVAEKKIFDFSPNAILLIIHSSEIIRMMGNLTQLVQAGVPIEYPYVRDKLEQAGARKEMGTPELRRRLSPFADDLVKWSFQRMVDQARDHHISIVGILFPEPMRGRQRDLARIGALAAQTGMPLVSLDGAYGTLPLDSVKLAPADIHLNPLGHRLIADRLFRALHDGEGHFTLQSGSHD